MSKHAVVIVGATGVRSGRGTFVFWVHLSADPLDVAPVQAPVVL